MKRIAVLCVTAMMSLMMAVPAFAATQDKAQNKETRTEIAAVRADLKELNGKIKEVHLENKTLSAEFKTMKVAKKAGDDGGLSKEDWKEIRELAGEMKSTRTQLKETKGDVSAMRKMASASIKAKDLETGLDQLQKAKELKAERLELLNKVNVQLEKITSVQ